MAQVKEQNPAQAQNNPNRNSESGGEKRTRTRRPYYNRRPRRTQQPKEAAVPIHIYPLGGLGEVGKNMTVYECNGDMIIVDCGLVFPDSEMYGVDMVIPDFTFVVQNKDKIKGLLITHGHEDHIGGVPYLLKLRPDIPLIGSKLTLAFVEAKCKEHRINPTLVEVKGRDKLKVGPFNLEFVNVTHSIPDALAVFVQTPAGSLIDTGDIKLDQLPLDHRITDLVEFGKLGEKGVDLLMMDSTNAEVPGFVKPETSIGPALDQAFAQATRKIIVASFSSHVHRVQQVVDAAHKYGRKVVFVGPCVAKRKEVKMDPCVDFTLTFEEVGSVLAGMDIKIEEAQPFTVLRNSVREAHGFAQAGGVINAVKVYLKEDQDASLNTIQVANLTKKNVALLRAYAKTGKAPGQFIEVMACEGGCVTGPCVHGDRSAGQKQLLKELTKY